MNNKLAADADGNVMVELRTPAADERLKDIRGAILAAVSGCGCTEPVARDIVLAVDEACQNVVRHAYAGTTDGEMVVEVRRLGDDVVVLLRDFADTVDPETIKPRDLDDVRPGGLGTHFINEIMDEVEFQPPPAGRGNLLRMVKRIA